MSPKRRLEYLSAKVATTLRLSNACESSLAAENVNQVAK